MFCKHCGNEVQDDVVICMKCGKQVQELKSSTQQQEMPQVIINNTNMNTNTNQGCMMGKPKNKGLAIILCAVGLLGFAGLHKFYEGKILLGILYIVTCGFLWVGTIIDLISLLGKPNPYYV